MIELPNLINHLAPVTEKYLTLLRVHPSKRYNYAARKYFNLQVIEVEQHQHKCKKGESWLYFAVSAKANLSSLTVQELLYVGAQTQDRMFRGDGGIGALNYHHAEMRAGNGNDNPITLLNTGQEITIYRVMANRIQNIVSESPELYRLEVLAEQPRTSRKHLGWWYEQYILYSEPRVWRWNTAPASKDIAKIFDIKK